MQVADGATAGAMTTGAAVVVAVGVGATTTGEVAEAVWESTVAVSFFLALDVCSSTLRIAT